MTVVDIWRDILLDSPILHHRPDFRFDPYFYVCNAPDPEVAGQDPLQHFLTVGLQNGYVGTTYWQLLKELPSLDSVVASLVAHQGLKAAMLAKEPGANELAFELMLLGSPTDERMSDFSAQHYSRLYPEVEKAGLAPFLHFIKFGQAEGRRTLKDVRRNQIQGGKAFDPSRRSCLICVHEFSRSGAPVVGLDLVRGAAEHHNVFVASLRGGVIRDDFVDAATAVFTSEHPTIDFDYFEAEGVEQIDFAILNSVECLEFMPALVARKIPFANYLHEYTEYTLPSHKPLFTALFSDLLVFSSDHVRKSWLSMFSDIEFDYQRDSIVVPQADLHIGKADIAAKALCREKLSRLIGRDCRDAKIIFGAGHAHWRKGTDIFVMAAQMAKLRDPAAIFIWIGDGFNHEDFTFGVWMDKHLQEANANSPEGNLFFFPSGPLYKDICQAADVMFLSSRLDPLPNVVFDAVRNGNHVVLFQNATGFGDATYENHPALTVVPFGDLMGACDALLAAPKKGASVAVATRDMTQTHGSIFDRIATALDARLASQRNFALGVGKYDVPIMAGRGAHNAAARQAEREKLWSYQRRFVWKSTQDAERALRKSGHTVHAQTKVLSYTDVAPSAAQSVSLHIHAFYAEELEAELSRYCAFRHVRRLIVTTDTDQKAGRISAVMGAHGLNGEVQVFANVGRDILPFLQLFGTGGLAFDASNDDVWAHVHLKKSLTWASSGDVWRTFLLDILLGNEDRVSVAFERASQPDVGLVGAFDPYVFGWAGSHRVLPKFAGRLPIPAPDQPLLFPVGNMFFTRAGVVRQMAALFGEAYPWPNEPIPNDGTVFHMIERLWPTMAAAGGFGIEFLDKPGQPRT